MAELIKRLVSGGQTGAERAALGVAMLYGIPHGGWCIKGRRAEDGLIGSRYQLVETPSSICLQRVEWNVRDSDGTVIFTLSGKLTGDSLRTAQFASKHNKPWLHVFPARFYYPAHPVVIFAQDHGISTLNVTGTRGSKAPDLYLWVFQALEHAHFRTKFLNRRRE